MATDRSLIKVGSRLKDNDRRMRGRYLTVTRVLPNGVEAVDGTRRPRLYLMDRIHTDGKERKYGLNLVEG